MTNGRQSICSFVVFLASIVIISLCLTNVETLSVINRLEEWTPCKELKRMESLDNCLCGRNEAESTYKVNCDHVVFGTDFPIFPFHQNITHFSHKFVNHQNIPQQVFVASKIPLRSVDLSHNWIRRLTEKSLDGLTETLEFLDLSHNLLGDQLNPIYSTTELKLLPRLKVLKMGNNQIIDLDDGLLEGALSLQEFHVDNNDIKHVPKSSFSGPNALKILNLSNNRLAMLGSGDFSTQPSLLMLNVSRNKIGNIQGKTFQGMKNLKMIDLSWNRLRRFNSDSFHGLSAIEGLDLSYNYVTEIPFSALLPLKTLRVIRLTGNLIQQLGDSSQANLLSLEKLDLSRNRINEIPPEFFRGMRNLLDLNLGVNQLRTIPGRVFNDLPNLQRLNLKDNNLLTFPSAALEPLTSLYSLILDYNRISVLVPLKPNNISVLSISNNLIRDIPPDAFHNFPGLLYLNFYGNLIENVEEVLFPPLLKQLNIGLNNLKTVPRFQLQELQILKLSRNSLTQLLEHNFVLLRNLKELDLSSNLITSFHENTFDGLERLQTLDLSNNNIENIPKIQDLDLLKTFNLSHNHAKEIQNQNLNNLPSLEDLDLSYNYLTDLKEDSLINSTKLETIHLQGNKLNSFRGFSNLMEKLKVLDLSKNQISYIYPNSLESLVSVENLNLGNNQLTMLPAEFLKSCQKLQILNLSKNQMKLLNQMNFSNFPLLRRVDLSQNLIEFIPPNVFTNSSQLQFLSLAANKLEAVDSTMFHGVLRLELDLSNNYLSSLPPTLFERLRVHKLQRINLSKNTFKSIPFEALEKQYFFLESIDFSENQLTHIPSNLNILVNVKSLDLSKNPLEERSVENILSEPKTVRHLNLANIGLKQLPVLETPFLRSLNVSGNSLQGFEENAFKRTTLLSSLAMESNLLTSLGSKFPASVTHLDLSFNPLVSINASAMPTTLQSLKMTDLKQVMRIEKIGLLKDLVSLEMYNLPKLGYLDIRGLLVNLPYLEHFDLDVKDHQIVDQIHPGMNSRVTFIGLRGKKINSISTGAFAGLTSANVKICLVNTSLTLLPSILVPVPMSSNIVLDLSGSKIYNLSPPFLSQNIILEGFSPTCDCNAIHLVRYLKNVGSSVMCSAPRKMVGHAVSALNMNDLNCDPGVSTTQSPLFSGSSDIFLTTSAARPIPDDIIWSLPPKDKDKERESKLSKSSSSKANDSLVVATKILPEDVHNMDTLIIGIVGGVLGIIIFFVFMIICFVKMSNSSSSNMPNGVPYPVASTAMHGLHGGNSYIIPGPGSGSVSGSKCMCRGNIPGNDPMYGPTSYTSTIGRHGKVFQECNCMVNVPQSNMNMGVLESQIWNGTYRGRAPMGMNGGYDMTMTDVMDGNATMGYHRNQFHRPLPYLIPCESERR